MYGFIKWWKMKRMYDGVRKADSELIGQLLRYILRLYADQYPEDEFVFLTLPKYDSAERKRTLEAMCRVLTK